MLLEKFFFLITCFHIVKMATFARPKRELSSAGLEHLPYKQGVNGSSPLVPTIKEAKRLLFSQAPIHRLDTLSRKP